MTQKLLSLVAMAALLVVAAGETVEAAPCCQARQPRVRQCRPVRECRPVRTRACRPVRVRATNCCATACSPCAAGACATGTVHEGHAVEEVPAVPQGDAPAPPPETL